MNKFIKNSILNIMISSLLIIINPVYSFATTQSRSATMAVTVRVIKAKETKVITNQKLPKAK